MTLTTAQQATLKAHILATPVLNAFPNNEDGAQGIADLLNVQAVPDFTVWKTNVTLNEMMNAMDGPEFESLTTAETGRLQAFAAFSPEGMNPSFADKRQLFDDTFNGAGGTNTRPALLALWKRLSNEVEKLFATGTGSDADPAITDFEGNISRQDVFIARNS